jgi:C4-dicarboxylate-specific signal transduction histidine kinase
MKILIVDDELVSRKKLEKIMESLGECESVENGEDALKIATAENPPDLILLDIMMPGMDGYEVCKRLKAVPETKDIPVIFLSAMDDKADIIQGLEMGAVDYITKPFQKAEVKARALTHLSLKKMREDLYAQNIILESQVKEIQEKTDQLRQKDLQLIEMDRIAGIGTLAAGIAHEINNPLGFVKSSIGFLKKGVDKMVGALGYWDDKPVSEPLLKDYNDYLAKINFEHLTGSLETKFDRIQRGIERIMKIVKSLRSFSRLDMETVGKIDINQSIEDAVEILSTQDAKDVEFVREFQEVPLTKCSPNEINQCLLHVLKNALDAVDHKGIIRMMTLCNEKGNQIIIRIADNGSGMSPEMVRQALNPFFTTKPVGSGTGIGLSLTERIIKRHGGMINVSSKEGEGTTVTMTLPVDGEVGREQH